MQSHIKKIGIYIGQLHFGGAEKQSILLAKALKNNYKVEFIVFKGHRIEKAYEQQLQNWQIPYFFLKGFSLFRLIKLFIIFRKRKYEVLFCYLPADQIIGTLLARLAGVKHVIGGIRNTKIMPKKFIFTKGIQNLFQDYIVFNSEEALNRYCQKGYRRNKSLVIENTIQIDTSYTARKSNDPTTILMVGRFVAQKDYQTAIKAISCLKYELQVNDIKLVIAGYGELHTMIQQWLNEYKLSSITQILIKPDNMNQLYLSSNILLNTSRFEGMSNSIMEGVSHGLPVVATDTGDIRKLVNDGESGFIVPVGDFKVMASKLKILCVDKKLREQFGKKAYEIIQLNYSFKHFENKYIDLIQSLS